MEPVNYQVRDGVAVITIQNPPVNALSAEVKAGLDDALGRATENPAVSAMVIIGAGQTFIAGADIRQLQSMAYEGIVCSTLPQTLIEMENAPKPVIAAIHGNAFGGGLETAMAAHYRIASAGAKIGQPEVKLGIIPGAGGTQRLPRLAGVERAVEMCAFGDPITAEEAHRLGIIDRIAEGDLLTAAIEFAREAARRGAAPPRTRDRNGKLGTAEANAPIFAAAREKARKTRRNLAAPLAAIEAVEAATTLGFDEGCRTEREIFARLLVSDQAKALIHVFFAERAAAKIPGLAKDQPVYPIRSAVVIGAGTMGRGIAMCYANAGIPVRLKETNQELLDRAMAAIRASYESSAAKGRLSSEEIRRRLGLIGPQLGYEGFDQADVVTEAVFEDLAVKKKVFGELDGIAKPDAILATNTSYLNIDELAAASSRPHMVVGLHFFSPANVMRLLEIVPGRSTSSQVLATSMALAKRLGKLGVVAGNCPGFIGNRMLRVYRREAQLLIEEGAAPRQVDAVLEDWGMAMGPFAVQDLAGIDIAMNSRHVFSQFEKPGARPPRVIEKLYAAGRYGQKTGAGWYRYDEKRNALPDPAVDALIEAAVQEAGIRWREISAAEIIDRTIYALVNEGARILDEGHALRASDIDLVYLNGYGFPACRGGPLCYADAVGLKAVHDRIREFRQAFGESWEPGPLLERLAATGETFAHWDAQRESKAAAP